MEDPPKRLLTHLSYILLLEAFAISAGCFDARFPSIYFAITPSANCYFKLIVFPNARSVLTSMKPNSIFYILTTARYDSQDLFFMDLLFLSNWNQDASSPILGNNSATDVKLLRVLQHLCLNNCLK